MIVGVGVLVGVNVGVRLGVAVAVGVGVPVCVGVGEDSAKVSVHAGATAWGATSGTVGATGVFLLSC